jgi:hypothetical protein
LISWYERHALALPCLSLFASIIVMLLFLTTLNSSAHVQAVTRVTMKSSF